MSKVRVGAMVMALMLSGSLAYASGSFSPSGGSGKGDKYNLGKAIVMDKVPGVESCKGCHKRFSRGKLRGLDTGVSTFIRNCNGHTPCYDKMSSREGAAVDAYFSKRYNLR